MRSSVFINYRRTDAGGHAGRLFDRLRRWYGHDAVFFDLDGIDAGDSFPKRIEEALRAANVVLVVIGPDWLDTMNRRATEPSVDYVREEISLALERLTSGEPVTVLPVLMGDSAMPTINALSDELRDALAPLCELNAHVFQGNQADWENQLEQLRRRLVALPHAPDAGLHAELTASYRRLIAELPEHLRFELARGLVQLNKKLFSDARSTFECNHQENPTESAPLFFLAVALLEGKRPCQLPLTRIKLIEQYIRSCLALNEQNPPCLVLWAQLRYDYYDANSMRTDSPSLESLLAQTNVRQVSTSMAQFLLEQAPVPDGPATQHLRHRAREVPVARSRLSLLAFWKRGL